VFFWFFALSITHTKIFIFFGCPFCEWRAGGFFAPAITRSLGAKKAMIFGGATYVVFVASLIYMITPVVLGCSVRLRLSVARAPLHYTLSQRSPIQPGPLECAPQRAKLVWMSTHDATVAFTCLIFSVVACLPLGTRP
jgi:hypothetical protein